MVHIATFLLIMNVDLSYTELRFPIDEGLLYMPNRTGNICPKKPHMTVVHRDKISEIEKVNERITFIEKMMNAYNLRDVLMSINNPRRLLWLNFIAGVARGLGLTVGTAIVLAVLFFILQNFVSLPFIGEHIAELIKIIDEYRGDIYRY